MAQSHKIRHELTKRIEPAVRGQSANSASFGLRKGASAVQSQTCRSHVRQNPGDNVVHFLQYKRMVEGGQDPFGHATQAIACP